MISAYIPMGEFFVFSFAILYVLVRFVPIIRLWVEQLGKVLLVRAFPHTSDNEHYKFAILRIVFGLVLLFRAINIQMLLLPDERLSMVGLFSSVDIIASLLLIVGLFTQATLVFYIFIMWHVGEDVLATSTLGNDIAAILSFLLLLTCAGKFFSVDSLIIKRYRFNPAFLLYSQARPSAITIALAKFIALFSYWLVCVYSLAIHVNETAWTTGVAGPLLLSNNFMSQWHTWFETIFVAHSFATSVAKASLWVMMIWYLTVLPFTLLGGRPRNYVIVWGVMFFTLSLLVLNLGSLAQIEFLLWAGVFWHRFGLSSKSKYLVFYDDKCNLCDRTVQVITYLDVFDRLQLMPVSLSAEQLLQYSIKTEDALTDLYGVDSESGEVRAGYAFYCRLTQRVVLLWPLVPFLWAGLAFGTGPRIYRMIAKRRLQLLGVCMLASPKASYHNPVEKDDRPPVVVITFVVHAILLGVIYFVSIPAPYIGISGAGGPAVNASEFYGITPIDVFNRTDLRMSENWFTLTSSDTKTLLPVFSENGERLRYHKSDRVYFGYTLRFRRNEIDQADCAFDREFKTIDYLTRIWTNHSSIGHGRRKFTYTQYYQPLPNNAFLLKSAYVIEKPVIRCAREYEISVN
jgi:predicted DCC family thiol-disulfide oxidoreductase YuxK